MTWIEAGFFHKSSDDYKFWEIKKENGHGSTCYTQLLPKALFENILSGSFYKDFFFSMEMIIYTLNIKTTVTWHRGFYGCQGYKKKNVIIKRKS